MVVLDMLHRILDFLNEALSKYIYGYLHVCVCIARTFRALLGGTLQERFLNRP